MYTISCETFIYFRAFGAEIYKIDYQNSLIAQCVNKIKLTRNESN